MTIDIKLILYIPLLFFVGGINYLTYYKEIEHSDNFIETSMERSSIIILGSFGIINSIFLYLLIIKPVYEFFDEAFTLIIKPAYKYFRNYSTNSKKERKVYNE